MKSVVFEGNTLEIIRQLPGDGRFASCSNAWIDFMFNVYRLPI